eukprot:795910-Rhodomonas_salina.1
MSSGDRPKASASCAEACGSRCLAQHCVLEVIQPVTAHLMCVNDDVDAEMKRFPFRLKPA